MRQFLKTFSRGLFEAFTPRRRSGPTQIVPRSSVSGRALTAVISIMSFLACITAGVVYMVNQSANDWFNDIASEVTVQVQPLDGVKMKKRLARVASLLRHQRGISSVHVFTLEESAALLEPWLGAGDAISTLPVPRLIAVVIDRSNPPDLAAVRRRLDDRFRGVLLDDHRQWQAQIRSLTRSVALGGIGILLLVATATIAVVISAARSAMASNHEIVEVLHFVGARRKFIASEFERHFLALGIRSGLLGALAAVIIFAIAPMAVRMLGGGSATASEIHQLVGSARLDMGGYFLMGGIVIMVAAICMFTSSYWVDRILDTQGSIANPAAGTRKRRSPKTASVPNGRESGGWMGRTAGMAMKLALLSIVVFAIGFIIFAIRIDSDSTMPARPADGIVVLTGGQHRIREGLRLLSASKARRLLISGVHIHTTRRQLASLEPQAQSLFDCCIDLGREALDTAGNAREASAWAQEKGYRSLIVVTSAYHMPRAMAEFKRVMPDYKLTPHAAVSPSLHIDRWWSDSASFKLLFSEYVKYIPAMAKSSLASLNRLFAGGSGKSSSPRRRL